MTKAAATGPVFARGGAGDWVETDPGNRRRVLLHGEEMMLVAFAFDTGAVGAPHSHPHAQTSYVAEGRFAVTIGERTETLVAGDGFIVPPNTVHGVTALEAGLLIDSFTPPRADFL